MTAKGLLLVSSVVFAVTGVAYLLVPGLALGLVGIESTPASDFLLRTEGVALVFGAVVVWILRDGGPREHRVVLLALAGYYVGGSIVDLVAFSQAIVGTAAVPSAVVRIAIGAFCAALAVRGASTIP